MPVHIDEAKELSRCSFSASESLISPEGPTSEAEKEKVIEIRNLSFIYMPGITL